MDDEALRHCIDANRVCRKAPRNEDNGSDEGNLSNRVTTTMMVKSKCRKYTCCGYDGALLALLSTTVYRKGIDLYL
eukprot:scaffold5826_cov113-Skeletonema_menzelii.AAC.2